MTDRLDRYSMVTTRTTLMASSLRLFEVATAQGRMMRADGTFAKLDKTPEGRAVGVQVNRTNRERILGLTKTSEDNWRRAIRDWVDVRLAHRCKRGVDFLFLEPLDGAAAVCPGCFVSLAHGEPSVELTESVSEAHTSAAAIAAMSSGDASSGGGYYGVEEGDEGGPSGVIGPDVAKKLLLEGRSKDAPPSDEEALDAIKEMLGAKEMPA